MMRNARLLVYLLAALVGSHCATAQVITTIAGTSFTFPSSPLPALNVPLGLLQGIAVDAHGNVYAGDLSNNVVIRFVPGGLMTVVAGNGIQGFSGDGGHATIASLNQPSGVAVDATGNLYIADFNNNRIRKVSPGGTITTIAGNGVADFSGDGGSATSASLSGPVGVAVDSDGNNLYIADKGNQRIRRVSGGTIATIAGNGVADFSGDGGSATSASLNSPEALAVDSAGNVYIADAGNSRIREVSGVTIKTVAGNGATGFSGDGVPATNSSLYYPQGVAVDSAGTLYIADVFNNRVRKVSGGMITTVAGVGAGRFSGDDGPAKIASLDGPTGVAVDSAGDLFVIDYFNRRIRKVSSGTITTVAGNENEAFGDGGPATSALLNLPFAVAIDRAGTLYIADFDNNRIRKVSGGTITTVAGNGTAGFSGDGGPATNASLNGPEGVAVDSSGNLYIADFFNNRIRKVSGGTIATIAGNEVADFSGDEGPANKATLHGPSGVAIDSMDNLYIADERNNRIRKVSGGIITTVAGNGTQGFSGDKGAATSAGLYNPYAVAVDSVGNLYIATVGNPNIPDQVNSRIRKVSGGTITTVAGGGSALGDGVPATSAELNHPYGVAVDSAGNLYIADTYDQRLRKVAGGTINTVAGNGTQGFSGDGGAATSASLFYPEGLALDSSGNLYVADSSNGRIREIFAAPVSITVSPMILIFSATSGGAAPVAQSVNVSSSVVGLPFSVLASDPWLSVTPSGGSTPTVLQVNVDPSQLSAKTYTGSITITAPGATQTVGVNFAVSAAATGKLAVNSPSVSFSVTQGSASTSAQLSVSNQGGGSIALTASATTSTGGSWLQVSPASGTATPATATPLTVTVTPGSLVAGTYSGSIVVNSSTTGESITVPVTMAVSALQQKILISQTGLTFIAVEQGGAPLPQSFGILNTGQGSMSWSASASTLSGGSWLSIDQGSGTVATPFTDVSLVNASINPSGLAAGNYYGQVQVTSAGAANSPQSVSVVLNVLPAGSNPGAELQPTGLIFIGQPGRSPVSQNVMVSNPSAGAITFAGAFFTLPTGGNWTKFVPTNATVQPNAPAQMVVQPDYTNLSAGVYQGFLTLGFLDGSARTVHVLAVVAPGTSSSAARKDFIPEASSGCGPLQVLSTSLDATSSVTLLQPASLKARVVDSCGNPVTSGTVYATFSNKDSQVNLVPEMNGNWGGTWQPRNGAQPRVTVTFVAFHEQGTSTLSGGKTLTVSVQSGAPTPLAVGVANAASGVGAFTAPGGLVSIYGQQLADGTDLPDNVPFPKKLNGTQVFIGGQALPLRYAGSGQINAQVPFELASNTNLQLIVQRGTTSSVPQDVVVAAAQPAVYTQDQSGSGAGIIVDANTGVLVTPSAPAKIGDTLVIYCNGLGAVSPAVPTGQLAPSVEPFARTVNPVTVTIGTVTIPASFAGLVPGYPDLYIANVLIPAGVAAGDQVPVVLNIAGQSSPMVTVAIR